MRQLLATLLVTTLATTASAQSLGYKEGPMRTPRTIKQAVGWRTPFMKAEYDQSGKKIHYYFRPDFSRSTLNLGWGYGPIQSFGWWSNSTFRSDYTASYYSSVGAFTLAYNYHINPWLELQVPITLSHATGTYTDMTRGRSDWFSENWFVITPSIKISWLASRNFTLYSRIGVGVGTCGRYSEYNDTYESRLSFTWQFMPAGIETGGRVNFYLEGGIGSLGAVQAGVKLNFNKPKKKITL